MQIDDILKPLNKKPYPVTIEFKGNPKKYKYGFLKPTPDEGKFRLEFTDSEDCIISTKNMAIKDDLKYSANGYSLVKIEQLLRENECMINIFQFSKKIRWGFLDIGFAPNKVPAPSKVPSEDSVILNINGTNYICIQLYNDSEETATPESEEASDFIKLFDNEKFSFKIIGPTTQIHVKKSNEILLGKWIKYGKAKLNSICLVECPEVCFDTFDNIANIDTRIKNILKINKNLENSFIKIWEKYATKEQERLIKEAQEMGVIPYTRELINETTYKLLLAEPDHIKKLKKDMDINPVTRDKVPPYVTDQNIKNVYVKDIIELPQVKIEKTLLNAIIITCDRNTVIPEKGVIILSIAGDQIQIDRRNKARHILFGNPNNSRLPLLFLDNPDLPKTYQYSTKTPGLSPKIINKIFPHHPPSPTQRKTVELAINTPDILLIQGPPGTGKTTVITAITERLNEMLNAQANNPLATLVTAYQHDAVDNMTTRLSINSLPQSKKGVKQGSTEIITKNDEVLDNWCSNIAIELKEKYPDIDKKRDSLKLEKVYEQYMDNPLISTTIRLMKLILNLPNEILDSSLRKQSESISSSLQADTSSNSNDMLSIYNIRTTKEGILDDGKAQIKVLLEISRLEDTEKTFLEDLKTSLIQNTDISPETLEELIELKNTLIGRYELAELSHYDPIPRADIKKIYKEILPKLYLLEKDSKERVKRIRAEFYDKLQDAKDAIGIQTELKNYEFVKASTIQQSFNRDKSYDTVIVDEAGRPSPLDLMIPFSMAQNRLILVGDHRQLPHLLDEDIIKEKDFAEPEKQLLEVSLFHHLFKELKKMEKKDGIIRTITLNEQYRMHPILGEFVSDQFYKPHGEAYSSPLPAENFPHKIPEAENTPALWINVPSTGEKEEPRSRISEAECIVEYIEKWLEDPACAELEFGIITFYRDQEKELRKLLDKKIDDQSRIRLGTVDSFQGVEFDIIILSTARSRDITRYNINSPHKEAIEAYGFLLKKNRLCVSMSRQKRLLVVVGDSNMVQGAFANKYARELCAFYELCHEKGRVLEWSR